MAFCAKCGAQMADGAKFCPGCGTTAQGTQGTGAYQAPNSEGYSEADDIAQNKGISVFAYLAFCS